ncbi:Importin subunit alpha-2 AltName: Full=Importin-1; AltName: Full=Karyopherin subunit alpha-2 [Serendipita indica DSM 11827]|uniref:Importin subunit alpha n=1 Tax=Serendipita indica (strain DSM 11827) TaxID=1109443 RepID=G4TCW6_SERID|nr:Importin subunit alpha-2 AltName: Full=Importin-1; AltName: Full=Karyopherin subunit alpha-2 [Serendipita indica DSM 11827]CCA69168.1 probable SRP1-Importin alpha [Serendipita indica DSM 11827]
MSSNEVRKRREEQQVEIRRQKREENLAKRRNLFTSGTNDGDSDDEGAAEWEAEGEMLVQGVRSGELHQQIEATARIRRLLSKEDNPPIEQVIRAGLVPYFVNFLQSPDQQLQFESAWALTNVASGTSEQTQLILNNGAVPPLVKLLSSPSPEVREQAVWALGNIAGDGANFRDYVLQSGVMEPLLAVIGNDSSSLNLVRNAIWTLSNLCRGKNPPPDWEIVSKALPLLAKNIYSSDMDTLVDASWALSYLSDGSNQHIQAVVEAGVCRRLVDLLTHPSPQVQTPALRCIGNIVTGDDLQTQVVIASGALPALLPIFRTSREGLRKEACWTVSNILAGTTKQIQAIIDAGIWPELVNCLSSTEPRTRREACWAVSNATSGASPDQIAYFVDQNTLGPLCAMLSMMDNRIIKVTLEALDNILKNGELLKIALGQGASNPYAAIVEEVGGMVAIHNLQSHDNNEIYNISYRIMETYFADEEDDVPIADDGGFKLQRGEAPAAPFNFGGNWGS